MRCRPLSKDWRYILHADMDAFYASVEQHDHPCLRGKPLVVGGSPEARGVVAAASYEARKLGIHSAMPMRTAVRISKDVVRVSPRFDRYREVSRQVIGVLSDISTIIQPLALDEAYLDVSNHGDFRDCQILARRLKHNIHTLTGLHVTVGGGTTKTVAKIASQSGKPNGLLLIPPGKEQDFLFALKVEALGGVGPVTKIALNQAHIYSIADLALARPETLANLLGRRGNDLQIRALGLDDDPVETSTTPQSISVETTLPADVSIPAQLNQELVHLSKNVAERLTAARLRGRTITLKLRLADFRTLTRQTSLASPTNSAPEINQSVTRLLERVLEAGMQVRLLGVTVSKFGESYQPRLFDDNTS